jgi:hypothetical protein
VKPSQRRFLDTAVVTSLASRPENAENHSKNVGKIEKFELATDALYVTGALYVKSLYSVNRKLLSNGLI